MTGPLGMRTVDDEPLGTRTVDDEPLGMRTVECTGSLLPFLLTVSIHLVASLSSSLTVPCFFVVTIHAELAWFTSKHDSMTKMIYNPSWDLVSRAPQSIPQASGSNQTGSPLSTMPHPPSTPPNKPNSPEEQASPEPQNSLDPRPGSPAPDSREQHIFQPQNRLPRNNASETDSEVAEVEEEEAATDSEIPKAEVEEREVDTSDTEAPQNSRHTSPDENGRPRNPDPYSQGQRPYQHHPRNHNDTSGTGGEVVEGVEEREEGEAAMGRDISDMELGQKDGGLR